MAKVRPLTEQRRAESRWQKQDTNFRKQIGGLLEVSGMTRLDLAHRLGIKSQQTIASRIEHPSGLRKSEERLLAAVFEEFGLKYDFTLGEGGAL